MNTNLSDVFVSVSFFVSDEDAYLRSKNASSLLGLKVIQLNVAAAQVAHSHCLQGREAEAVGQMSDLLVS